MLPKARWAFFLPLALLPLACARQSAVQSSPNAPPPQAKAIAWSYDYQAALTQARQEKKPLMVDVFATWCQPCHLLDEDVFSRPDVAQASSAFVPVKVDGDKYPDLRKQLAVSGYPTTIFLAPDGKEIGRVRAAVPYQSMLAEMARASQKAAALQPKSD